jgi:hemolysin-activating ACP:hemolysin acyltransferase
MIEAVRELMELSEFHRQYSEKDMQRLIYPAIKNNQCVVYYDEEKPVGMFTYMWLNSQAENGYLDGTRKLQPEDWETSPITGKLYVIDFIAPYNNGAKIARKCRSYLSAHTYTDNEGLFVRMAKSGRIGRVGRIHAKATYYSRAS